jgi:hypothetical protein
MFGKTTFKDKKYLLLSVFKNDIYHCGIYSNCGVNETITSINSGEIFHNLEDFVNSIVDGITENEWKTCLYYNESKKRWRSVKYLLRKV